MHNGVAGRMINVYALVMESCWEQSGTVRLQLLCQSIVTLLYAWDHLCSWSCSTLITGLRPLSLFTRLNNCLASICGNAALLATGVCMHLSTLNGPDIWPCSAVSQVHKKASHKRHAQQRRQLTSLISVWLLFTWYT